MLLTLSFGFFQDRELTQFTLTRMFMFHHLFAKVLHLPGKKEY